MKTTNLYRITHYGDELKEGKYTNKPLGIRLCKAQNSFRDADMEKVFLNYEKLDKKKKAQAKQFYRELFDTRTIEVIKHSCAYRMPAANLISERFKTPITENKIPQIPANNTVEIEVDISHMFASYFPIKLIGRVSLEEAAPLEIIES